MSTKFNYSSIGKTVDGTTFCSGVETLAENIIEDSEDDSMIVFPSATGWASLRSSSYRMTTENAELHLPFSIYKIKKVYLRPAKEKVTLRVATGYMGGTTDLELNISEFKDRNGDSFVLDITDLVVMKKEWEALPLATSINEYKENIVKDNTFYWEQGSNIIPVLSTIYKISQLNSSGIVDESPVYTRLLSRLNKTIENNSYIYTYVGDGWEQEYDLFEEFGVSTFLPYYDVRKWQFRIEYVPMSSKTKIRARKNAPTKEEYIQPFNQRAEINAASAFGKNMYLTAQKTGCKEIKLVKNYTRLNDIPPLGALVRHNGKKYRLVANHYDFTNTVYVKVTHTLSENWSEKSKHVAVDQKYRNWSIPQDTLWRNIYWEDYLRVGTSRKRGEDVTGGIALEYIMQVLSVTSSSDVTVDTFSWYTYDTVLGNIDGEVNAELRGASIPCSTYGIANSMIFSASFKDNLSAGLRASAWGEDNYLCEETLYCKADGTLDNVNVILGKGCGVSASFEIDDSMTINQATTVGLVESVQNVFYPAILRLPVVTDDVTDYLFANMVQTPVFDEKFCVYKDAGEAIKFTYQIHLIGEDDCVFGNKFAEHNPLIKDWKGKNRTFRVWLLTHYVREGVDVLETIAGDEYREKDEEWKFFDVEPEEQTSSEYGDVFKLTLKLAISEDLKEPKYKAWAITDENNNLYVACNDASVKTLYFQLHHKR